MIQNIDSIIDKIYNIPELKKIKNFKCFKYLRNNVISEFGDIIHTISFKHETLYLYVKHPTHKMYLQYQLQSLQSMLKKESSCQYIVQHLKRVLIKISY